MMCRNVDLLASIVGWWGAWTRLPYENERLEHCGEMEQLKLN